MEYKGKLKSWNDEKGFGFIAPETQGQRDVFLHISELKNMSRRPVGGDVIFYQLYTDSSGKTKAINARIEGILFVKPRKKLIAKQEKKSFVGSVISIIFIVGVIWFIYDNNTSDSFKKTQPPRFKAQNFIAWSEEQIKTSDYKNPAPNLVSERNTTEQKNNSSYHCDGRQHCSQMSSCAEAEFFIKNCPDTKMDGDADGMPCEDMCGH